MCLPVCLSVCGQSLQLSEVASVVWHGLLIAGYGNCAAADGWVGVWFLLGRVFFFF
jgi:hypothetical protein